MTTLNDLVSALLDVTGFLDNTEKEQIVRQINPTLNFSCTQIISAVEPEGIVLPMNVVWLCMDRKHKYYRRFLARKSKTPADGFKNTWELITNPNAFWAPQYYDPSDITGGTDLPDANMTTYGIARLTVDDKAPGRPTFVSTSDPRNTDAREPLPHDEMHPEKPLVQVKTVQGSVNMDAVKGVSGTTFRADNNIKASYRRLASSELLENKE